MTEYEINRQKVIDIITKNKHGYGNIFNHKELELKKWIFEVTKFSDLSNRKFCTRIWYIINNLHEYPLCRHCKKPITKDVYRLTDPRMDYCCLSCAGLSDICQAKRIASYLKNYGCDNPAKSPIVRSKIRKSLAKHFANKPKKVYLYAKYNRNLAKKRNYYTNVICNNKYIKPLFTIDEYMNVLQKDLGTQLFLWQCRLCGKVFKAPIRWFFVPNEKCYRTFARCYNCFPKYNCASLEEKHLAKFISSICPNDYEVINNKLDNFKLIKPYQVDIIIRNKTTKDIFLCIEYNGSRWHSLEMGSEFDRLLNKTKICESKGITLIHIYEDEWLDKNKRKTIEAYLYALLNSLNMFSDDVIVVNRDKFPMTIQPVGYLLINQSEIEIIKRYSLFNDTLYSVPNCGKLTYKKELV